MWRYMCCSFDLPTSFGPCKSAVFQGSVVNTNLSDDTISADYNHWWYKHTSWPPRGSILQAVQWPNRLIWPSTICHSANSLPWRNSRRCRVTRSDLPAPDVSVIDVGLSDHGMVKWCLDLEKPTPLYETYTKRSWRGFDVDEFRSTLQMWQLCDLDFISSQTDVKTMALSYNTVVTDILDRLAPPLETTRRKSPVIWRGLSSDQGNSS